MYLGAKPDSTGGLAYMRSSNSLGKQGLKLSSMTPAYSRSVVAGSALEMSFHFCVRSWDNQGGVCLTWLHAIRFSRSNFLQSSQISWQSQYTNKGSPFSSRSLMIRENQFWLPSGLLSAMSTVFFIWHIGAMTLKKRSGCVWAASSTMIKSAPVPRVCWKKKKLALNITIPQTKFYFLVVFCFFSLDCGTGLDFGVEADK